MMSEGVLYISTGMKYVKAAIRSARTVNKFCPELPIHLFTDPLCYDHFDFKNSLCPFTTVEIIENPHRRSKVDYISQSPYEFTLYMDSDTALAADITGLFKLLERFDIALAHAQRRNTHANLSPWRIELPEAFPQMNGGIILYRNTPGVKKLLLDWSQSFSELGSKRDQITLRELLWLSDLRIATLPPEYNIRFLKYPLMWSKSEAQPKIYHLKQFHHGWFYWVNKNNLLGKIGRRIIPKKWIDPD